MPKLYEWETGVYYWVNLVNDKFYVGGAYASFNARKATHLNGLRNNKHRNKHLQAAWNKYGEDNFLFVVIETCPEDMVKQLEQKYIDRFWSSDELYNLSPSAGSTLGIKHSEETIAKYKAAMQLIAGDISERMKGNTNGRGCKGQIVSEETRRKISKKLTGRVGHGRGVPKPRDQVEKMRAALTGRKQPRDVVEKRALAARGKKRTPEQKLRISLGRKKKNAERRAARLINEGVQS